MVASSAKLAKPGSAAVAVRLPGHGGEDAGGGLTLGAIGLPAWLSDRHSFAIIDANAPAVTLFGFPLSVLRTLSLPDLLSPGERDRLTASRQGSGPSSALAVWCYRNADGTDREVITCERPFIFGDRELVLGLMIDRAEVAGLRGLRDAPSVLGALIDELPTGVFVKDMRGGGRYVVYNAAAGEIVGRDPGAILGLSDVEAFGARDAATFVAQDRGVMLSGLQLVIEQEPVSRPDGHVRLIRTIKKPLPPSEGGTPRYLLGLSEDVTDRVADRSRIAHLAHHDFLTDLPNRLSFTEHLGHLLGRRSRRPALALLLLDLDGFKLVNDTHGHQTGDVLLKRVAERLRACGSRFHLVARLGGDEFAILTHAKIPQTALALADRVRSSLEAPFDLGRCVVQVGTSIGIAFASTGGSSEDVLMRHADAALYAAKATGPDTIRVYDPSMATALEAQAALAEDLRRALAAEQFELDYQPQFAAADDRVIGFEALLRWRHPARGRLAPAHFVPAAERIGLIVPLGTWVLRQACAEAARWPSRLTISVNLSTLQIKQGAGLVRIVEEALEVSGLSPDRLELEVTESVMLADATANLATLHLLRALGVRIALDDFGTGYSSLNHLRAFPFNRVKLDGRFIDDLGGNPDGLAILRAVIGLGAALAMETTAEGVETAEQLTLLKCEGFDSLQGFLIGRPLTGDAARLMAISSPS